MLHIILLILKITGIVFLVLLGILLTLLLLVLLVPIRYQVDGSFYGSPKGRAKITWLLHILSITASYEEELQVIIRIFGFPIRRPEEKSSEEAEDMLVHAMEVTEDKTEESVDRTAALPKAEEPLEAPEETQIPEKAQIPKETLEEIPKKAPEEIPKKTAQSGKKKTIAERILGKLSGILLKFKYFFQSICDKLKNINKMREQILAWVHDAENQKTMKLLLKQIKKLIRHILPRKGIGKITFGFEDPYMMGQAVTYASMLYPFCYRHISLFPVFDTAVLEGEGCFKGRVRVGTLLAIGIRVLLNKNFRRLLKGWLR